jgi:hypothetical protein
MGWFYQEALLKKGSVWHYTAYDKRPTFAKVHRYITRAWIGCLRWFTAFLLFCASLWKLNAWIYKRVVSRPLTFIGFMDQWEADAKGARVGLWAVVDPEKPWEYRKGKRDARKN